MLPSIPIGITTTAPEAGKAAPYDDGLGEDGLVTYRYRGTDPSHPNNVGLWRAMVEQKPLVYFLGVIPGRYLTFWPGFVTADNRRDLSFQVTLDLDKAVSLQDLAVEENLGRWYAFRVVKQRLHQVSFRERVLAAYRRTCSLCQLRHEELLDAAHIIPDGQPRGDPIIPNSLALCKLHHAAFDSNIIGIRPDLVIEVRKKHPWRDGWSDAAAQVAGTARINRHRASRSATPISASRPDDTPGSAPGVPSCLSCSRPRVSNSPHRWFSETPRIGYARGDQAALPLDGFRPNCVSGGRSASGARPRGRHRSHRRSACE
jgi:hypothetical protein